MTSTVEQSSQDIAAQVNAAAAPPPDRALLRRQLDETLARMVVVDKRLADHNYQTAIESGVKEEEALANYNREIELSNKNIEAKRQQLTAMASSTPGTTVNAAQAAATDQGNQRALDQIGEGQKTEQQRMLEEQDKFAEPAASAEQQAASPSVERQTVKERMVKYNSRRAPPSAPAAIQGAVEAATPAIAAAADVNAAKANDIMKAMTGGAGLAAVGSQVQGAVSAVGGAGGLAAIGSQVQGAVSAITNVAAPIVAVADGLYAAAGELVRGATTAFSAVTENITNMAQTVIGAPLQAIQNKLGSLGSAISGGITGTMVGIPGQIMQPISSTVQNDVLSISNVPWQGSNGINPDLPLYSVQSFGTDTVNAYQISNAELSFRDTSAYFTGDYNWRDQYVTSPPSASTVVSPRPGAPSNAQDAAARAMDRLFDQALSSRRGQ